MSENNGEYESYEVWKGWDDFFQFDAENAEYFSREFADYPFQGKKVLEMGFGEGRFLGWARAQGAEVVGSEANPALVAEAQKAGIATLPVNLNQVPEVCDNSFDVIAAFDVFEHLEVEQIYQTVRILERLLKPGGILMLRFPNGQSPFGLMPQHYDVTHKTALSGYKMEQICQGTSLQTLRYAGSYSVRGKMGLKRMVRFMRRSFQKCIGGALNAIYATRQPWDPVVTIVLKKQDALASAQSAA